MNFRFCPLQSSRVLNLRVYLARVVLTCLSLGLILSSHTQATVVNFSGLDLAGVESSAGQNFAYTPSDGSPAGTVNVRLLSGDVSAVGPGASPDTTGFDAQQVAGHLTPEVFEFTLSQAQTFTLTQNESLTSYETNAFTLLPSSAWTVVSYANAALTSSGGGSTVGFTGTDYRDQPPYGTYVIEGTGMRFLFDITDQPGVQNYGSAISLDIVSVPEPSTWTLLSIGVLGACVALRRHRPAV